MSDRGFNYVNVYVLLKKEDKVLLLLRKNTGYMDGFYGLAAGHVEKGESAKEAAVREAYEEVGVHLQPEDLKPVYVMHRNTERVNVDIFFECTRWKGEVINHEPHKCESIAFFPLRKLPSNTMPYLVHALSDIQQGVIYSELGWDVPAFSGGSKNRL